jgi:hypothetical protein
MRIDLENLKKAWLERMFEGHLSERPPIQKSSQFEKRIKSLNQKMRSRDLKAMVFEIIVIIVMLLFFVFYPLTINRRMIFMSFCLCSVLLFLTGACKLYRQGRDSNYDLPRKFFLMAQKEKIETRIRFEQRRFWFALPICIGCVVLPAGNGFPPWHQLILPVILAAGSYFGYHTSVKPRIRNILQPYLNAIKRRLAEYQEIESSS